VSTFYDHGIPKPAVSLKTVGRCQSGKDPVRLDAMGP
jgi:hypothetical protein